MKKRTRRPSVAQVRDIASRHRPRGWSVIERGEPRKDYWDEWHGPSDLGEVLALADFDSRTIFVPPLIDRDSLYLFLHECGHVHFDHHSLPDAPMWVIEYEAERYAISAMRAEGVAVPRDAVKAAKRYVKRCIQCSTNDEDPPSYIVRWAFS